MAGNNYMLEITMESRDDGRHTYIRRSFPVSTEKEEILEIEKYGYPYSAIKSIYLCKVNEKEGTIQVGVGKLSPTVYLNSFTTVVWDNGYINTRVMSHVPGDKKVYVTLYLYIA